MASSALNREIEHVVGELPRLPHLALPIIANDNDPIAKFNKALAEYYENLDTWFLELGPIILRFKEIYSAEAKVRGALGKSVEKALLAMWEKIDQTIEKSNVDLERGIITPAQRAIIDHSGNAKLKSTSDFIEKKWRKAMLQRHELLCEFRDKLKQVVWDNDPDAKGGPAFENTDDLIAFLNR